MTVQERFITRLLQEEALRGAFRHALSEPRGREQAVVWLRGQEHSPFTSVIVGESEAEGRAVWQPEFVQRVGDEERPGAHPLHDEGAFYCLDLSSVFSVVPLLEWGNGGEAVLDVCAAPGGKSILVWRGLAPRVLFANEVIHKRVRPLIANLSRCQVSEAAALSVESDRLAELFSAALELVVVDAPCSGQSLLVKGMSVPGCFHPQTINMNANRQKRILANAGKCVAKDGLLAYMTCTYSREENEGVCEWFLKRFPEFSLLPSNNLAQYQSTLTSLPCYRLWPWQGEGAGSFTALFRRLDGETKPLVSPPSLWCSMQR